MALADFGGAGKITLRRHVHAPFALDGFNQEGDGIGSNSCFQCFRIAIWNDLEARREWSKTVAVLIFGAKADDGRRSPVKVAMTDNNLGLTVSNALDLITPLANQFDRRFH